MGNTLDVHVDVLCCKYSSHTQCYGTYTMMRTGGYMYGRKRQHGPHAGAVITFPDYVTAAEALHMHQFVQISRVQRMTLLRKLPSMQLPLPELPTSAAM